MMNWLALVVIGIAVVVAVLVLIPVVVAAMRVARRRSMENRSPRERAEARVVDKRTLIRGSGSGPADQSYYVTFQFPSGNRLELEVPGHESGLLVPGDEGSLEWQGPRYVGFAREILR